MPKENLRALTFEEQMAVERARLDRLLEGDWPWHTCPLCGATVAPTGKPIHIAWHLGNLL